VYPVFIIGRQARLCAKVQYRVGITVLTSGRTADCYCSRPLERREHATLRSAIPTRYAPLNAFKLGFCAKSVRKTPRVSGEPEL